MAATYCLWTLSGSGAPRRLSPPRTPPAVTTDAATATRHQLSARRRARLSERLRQLAKICCKSSPQARLVAT
eukprot:scaffold262378_cov28-Tisochrysis_lutea.AAC.9